MVLKFRGILFFLFLLTCLSCSDQILFIGDPGYDYLNGSGIALWFPHLFKGGIPQRVLANNIEDITLLQDEKSATDLIITPYFWKDRQVIRDNFPESRKIWMGIPPDPMGDPFVSIYTDWNFPDSEKTFLLTQYFEKQKILLLYSQDPVSVELTESFESLAGEAVWDIEKLRMEKENWQSEIQSLNFDNYEQLVLFTGSFTAELMSELQKFGIPVGGQIFKAPLTPWTFRISPDWDEILHQACLQAKKGEKAESMAIAPEININRRIIGKKSTPD